MELEKVVPQVVEYPEFPSGQVVAARLGQEGRGVAVLCDRADRLSVRSTADKETATATLAQLKDERDRVDALRKSFSGPFDKVAKGINAIFRPFLDRLDQAEARLKVEYGRFVDLEERARAEAEERQRRAEQAVAASSPPGVAVVPRTTPGPAPAVTRVGAASASVRRPWTFDVVDPSSVPREFCSVDRDLVQARVDNLVKVMGACPPDAIPGVRVYQATQVAVGRRGRL